VARCEPTPFDFVQDRCAARAENGRTVHPRTVAERPPFIPRSDENLSASTRWAEWAALSRGSVSNTDGSRRAVRSGSGATPSSSCRRWASERKHCARRSIALREVRSIQRFSGGFPKRLRRQGPPNLPVSPAVMAGRWPSSGTRPQGACTRSRRNASCAGPTHSSCQPEGCRSTVG